MSGLRIGPSLPPIALSGSLHLAGLATFLIVTAMGGDPASITLKPMRLTVDYFPPPIAFAPPPADGAASGAQSSRGRVVPVPPRERAEGPDFAVDPGDFPTSPGGPITSALPEGSRGSSDPPGLPAAGSIEESANDLPSQYQEPPVPLSAPEPRYPEWEREAGIEGRVLLEVLVSRAGRVREIRVLDGERGLAKAATDAVQSWTFRPARWNGKAVAARVAIPVVFRLH